MRVRIHIVANVYPKSPRGRGRLKKNPECKVITMCYMVYKAIAMRDNKEEKREKKKHGRTRKSEKKRKEKMISNAQNITTFYADRTTKDEYPSV